MKKSRSLISYSLLAAGVIIFLLPLAWMVATSLKPAEQTMQLPPTWLPRSYYVERDGKKVEVIITRQVFRDRLLVRFQNEEKLSVVAPATVKDGQWIDERGFPTPVIVLKHMPANDQHPWAIVHARDNSFDDAVLRSEVKSRISLRWSNYPKAIAAMGEFPRYLANTLILCILNVIGTVISSSLAAYGFSRINWRGRDKVFLLVLATMMIPFPVVMVPIYAFYRELGMIGTLQPLWIGSFCANAFNVFLLRQFFRSIPQELSEAARIDGCSEFRIFWQIILPLCKPALTVTALFTFLGAWNDFLGPLVFLTDQKDFTLMLGLQFFQSQGGGTEWQYLMAASTLVTVPIILLFLFAQRAFIEGVSLTGGK
jgi:multiple sugar transport system permease protein